MREEEIKVRNAVSEYTGGYAKTLCRLLKSFELKAESPEDREKHLKKWIIDGKSIDEWLERYRSYEKRVLDNEEVLIHGTNGFHDIKISEPDEVKKFLFLTSYGMSEAEYFNRYQKKPSVEKKLYHTKNEKINSIIFEYTGGTIATPEKLLRHTDFKVNSPEDKVGHLRKWISDGKSVNEWFEHYRDYERRVLDGEEIIIHGVNGLKDCKITTPSKTRSFLFWTSFGMTEIEWLDTHYLGMQKRINAFYKLWAGNRQDLFENYIAHSEKLSVEDYLYKCTYQHDGEYFYELKDLLISLKIDSRYNPIQHRARRYMRKHPELSANEAAWHSINKEAYSPYSRCGFKACKGNPQTELFVMKCMDKFLDCEGFCKKYYHDFSFKHYKEIGVLNYGTQKIDDMLKRDKRVIQLSNQFNYNFSNWQNYRPDIYIPPCDKFPKGLFVEVDGEEYADDNSVFNKKNNSEKLLRGRLRYAVRTKIIKSFGIPILRIDNRVARQENYDIIAKQFLKFCN